MAVSEVSAESKRTTPVPRERPLGSYWISACSTLPIVVNNSTRSSLLVDQGSCHSLAAESFSILHRGSYIADVDDLTPVGSGCGVVGEGVRGNRGSDCSIGETTRGAATARASEASTATEAAEATASTTETASAAETTASEASAHATIPTAAAEAHTTTATTSISILSDLEVATLPVVAVELLNGVASIVRALENDNARSLGSTIRANMNISADDTTVSS